MSIADKLTQIAENEQRVYNAGYEKGKSEGGDTTAAYEQGVADGKQAEWSVFWDAFQNYGNRTDYNEAFKGAGWTTEAFKPKYPIVPSGTNAANYMFDSAKIGASELTDVPDFDFVERGIELDFSKANQMTYTFRSCWGIKRLGVIDFSSCSSVNRTFYSCRVKTIDKMVVHENLEYNNLFQYAGKLEDLTVEGTIGKNGFDTSACIKLTKASITSIVNALSDSTSGLTVTLSEAAVNTAFETSAETNDGTTSTEWLSLVATKQNWTISLV